MRAQEPSQHFTNMAKLDKTHQSRTWLLGGQASCSSGMLHRHWKNLSRDAIKAANAALRAAAPPSATLPAPFAPAAGVFEEAAGPPVAPLARLSSQPLQPAEARRGARWPGPASAAAGRGPEASATAPAASDSSSAHARSESCSPASAAAET